MALCALTACDAGHLGNPLTLPVRGVAAALGNAAYDARRARVSGFIEANAVALRAEARSAPGPAIAELVRLAGIPEAARPGLVRDLAEISGAPPPPDWVERATVIAMVHG